MFLPIDEATAEAIEGVIFDPFSNVDNFRPEAYSDVISGVAVDPTGVKVHIKFNLLILGQTVLEIYDCFTLLRTTTTTPADGLYDNRAKRHIA